MDITKQNLKWCWQCNVLHPFSQWLSSRFDHKEFWITELSRHVPPCSRTRSSCCSSGDGSLKVAGGCGRGMESSKRPSVSGLPTVALAADATDTPSNLTERWSVFCRLLLRLTVLWLWWPLSPPWLCWWIPWWMTDSHDGWWWICVAVWRVVVACVAIGACEEGLGSEFPTGWWRWRYSLSQPETSRIQNYLEYIYLHERDFKATFSWRTSNIQKRDIFGDVSNIFQKINVHKRFVTISRWFSQCAMRLRNYFKPDARLKLLVSFQIESSLRKILGSSL